MFSAFRASLLFNTVLQPAPMGPFVHLMQWQHIPQTNTVSTATVSRDAKRRRTFWFTDLCKLSLVIFVICRAFRFIQCCLKWHINAIVLISWAFDPRDDCVWSVRTMCTKGFTSYSEHTVLTYCWTTVFVRFVLLLCSWCCTVHIWSISSKFT